MNYAQALNKASLRHTTITPRKPNTKAGKRKLHFVIGHDPTLKLATIPGTDPVWSLIPFNQLLTEHKDIEIEVFKKIGKPGIISAQVVGGPKIRRGYQRDLDYSLDQYIQGYYWVNDYLADQGVSFTSSSWASEQIFRMALSKPLKVSNPLGRVLMKTSRGICRPGYTYTGKIEKWDIRSAYPSAMLANAHRFPTRLVPIETDEWDKRESTLVLAHVLIRPSYNEKDIPIIQEHPTDMVNPREQVVWLFDFEVRTLLEHHHHVEVIAAFKIVTADLSDEIGHWHSVLSPRYIDDIGYAGKILKSIANALWGSFASTLIYAYTWKYDTYGRAITDKVKRKAYGGNIGAEHIAAWNNALVSNRVFTEFIEPYNVLYFDTDGGFCRPIAESIGNGKFGEWRFEGYYHKLEVIGWQAYAAWNDDGPMIALSGVPDATYKDLCRYGDSMERKNYVNQYVEADPFNQIAAVASDRQLVSTVPPEVATLHASWQQIHRDIAPHAAQVNALHEDYAEVTEAQAAGFRHLSKYSRLVLDTPDKLGYSDTRHQEKERKVQDGRQGEQGQQGHFPGIRHSAT